MPLPTGPDPLLATARALRNRGAWAELCALDGAGHVELPEVTVIRAEADLRTGEFRSAHDRLVGLVPQLRAGDDPALCRRAVNMLGAAYFELGDLAPAEEMFGLALELASRASDDLMVARASNNLGMIDNIRGAHDEALARYRLAIPAYQRLGSPAGLAETYHNMAITCRDLEDLEQAERYERRAIEYGREAQNPRLLAMAHVGRAELGLLRGEPAVADAGARLGATEYERIPDPVGVADALRISGSARAMLRDPDGARQALDRAVELAREHGSALIEAEAREARARLLAEYRLGSPVDDARMAIALYRQLRAVRQQAATEAWLQALDPSSGTGH
ncbi:MAG TPA: tetratricopeptide repeat protein [Gemmatimonadales bacterium]|nr:tetratricopeptide repeat protein [Gemmatimonadales bacterium]